MTVHNGAPVAAFYADSAGGTADTTYLRNYLTIDRMFAALRTSLDGDPAAFDAEYDANLGYPKHVSIDPIANAVDDEYGVSITALNNPTTL